jgi:hypothetical protein
MSFRRTALLCAAIAVTFMPPGLEAAQRKNAQTAPETFTSPMQTKTGAGAAASTIKIQIDRYTPEGDRKTMTEALKFGGYPAFLQALKKAPAVGYVEVGDVKVMLRWAREEASPKGRSISLVTDQPVYFIGGGRADAKPRQGFELAVVQLTVDDYGLGMGTMAAAARVKPDGSGGVVLEDYADDPIRLTSVYRVIK